MTKHLELAEERHAMILMLAGPSVLATHARGAQEIDAAEQSRRIEKFEQTN